MIGIMEKTLEEDSLEKEEILAPKQKKAEDKTPSITNFFKPPSKPTPQTEESKTTDLRNYFQVTQKNVVADQPKISSDQNCQEDSSLKVEKANTLEDGDSKLKRSKRGGEGKQVGKKPKKHKSDSHHKSDDDRDFESPPQNRRKRKSRLDSDSIADFLDTEDSKQGHDLSENGSLQPVTRQDEMEVSGSDGTEMPCNGEDTQNTSTIVSYEDFLRNSMEDEDNKESEIENETQEAVESVPKEVDHPPDSIMLTPPDSRCSQESPSGDQPSTPPANQHSRKEEEANDSDTSLRKFITVKAQVHSPLDGRDKDSSPSASQMLRSETDSKKTGFGPRRLISNVCVLDSSPELRLISIETKEEPKKTGPVYNIFQPKATGFKKDLTKKEVTKKEATKEGATKEGATKENKQEESGHVKDLTKKKVNDNGEEKRTKEKQKELPDKADAVKKQDVDEDVAKGKKEKEGAIKKDSLTDKNTKLKRSKKGAVARKGSESQGSPLASKPSSNSKSLVKKKDEKESEKDPLIATRRVLRARVSKASTDADSSLEEFEDVQPLKTKANKQTKKDTPSSNKTSVKAEVKDKKRGSERSKTEHQKFKSSLMTGGKGQGPIRLKLTAIKASPKKNSKVTKAQQLLQKAKKGHQTTLVSKTLISRQFVKKKNTQTTFPHSKSMAVSSKSEKANSLNKKGKMEETREKPGKRSEKKVGDGAQTQTPRRRSSSRNKTKTPPKPAAKLAPIFTKQGQLAAAKKFKQDSLLAAIAESLPVDEASRDSLIDSKETMSDLSGPGLGFNMLEQLKMKPTLAQKDASMQLMKACHVLQKDDSNPLWRLPCPGFGNWKLKHDLEARTKISQEMKLAPSSIASPTSSCKFKLFEGHPPVSESDKKAVMDEILQANPKFPTQKIFKMYQAKKNGETQKKEKDNSDVQASNQGTQEAAASSESGPTTKGSKLSRGKRKAEDKIDEDNTRRKIARRSGRGRDGRSLEAGLDGEPTEVGDGEERSLRRSSRRSSMRVSRSEEVEERKDGDGKGEEEQKIEKDGKKATLVEESREEKRRAGLLWTEKYQPTAVSQMIGNTALCRKFSSWLTEWKKKTLRMKEKTRNAQRKDKRKSKGSRRIESDDESDDDFCCSDIEDSDDEDGLCNTILLSGPHGVGKTSLVYACAQELGFEVFEVNASSRRNGRQILAELGEGTQSHQVARQPGLSSTRFFNQSPTKSGSTKTASPKKKKKPALPKAFAGFVKIGSSSSPSTKRSPVKKPSVKKSPKKAIKQSPIKKITSSQQPGSQSAITKPKITSTSLILFDEVDIIFEEDKGFLSTVMSFMESSKRPIVLTTSDPRFSFSLSSRYDELTFKPPPLNPLVSHLKLLCLAENVPVSHQDLRLVAEFFDRDIRRCLQHLQFWVSSGATPKSDVSQQGPVGNDDVRELEMDAPRERASQEKPVSQSATSEMDTSGVVGDETRVSGAIEELTQELIDVETRIIAVGEYYSMKGYKPQDVLKIMDEMGLTSEKESPEDTCNETISIQESLGQHSFKTGLGNYCGLFESIAGLGNVAGPVIDSLHLLKRLDDPVILASILRAFHDLRIDAVHCNLPQIISSITTSKDTKTSYASLSSNEISSSESAGNELTENDKRKSSKLGGDLINIMAEHADRMSEMDTMLLHSQQQDSHLNRYGNNEWWHPLLMPGLSDSEDWVGDDYEQMDVRHCDARGEVNTVDMNCCLEAMSLRDCVKRCRRTVAEARQDERRWEEIQRSVLPSDHEALLRIKAITSEATLRETNSSVVRRLPDHLYTNHSALTLDYLPMLRGICRYEELRKEANLKRRFFHYLDSISFCLKPVTHLSLASILNPTQHP